MMMTVDGVACGKVFCFVFFVAGFMGWNRDGWIVCAERGRSSNFENDAVGTRDGVATLRGSL